MKRQPKQITFGSIISEEDSKKYFGFIYLISVNGRQYIGQKSFNRGLDWRYYKSSNTEIKELLKLHNGTFRVLAYAKDKRMLTYLETSFLFKFDVLTDESFCNGNILGKFYRHTLNLIKE